jgi:hypothetical protein
MELTPHEKEEAEKRVLERRGGGLRLGRSRSTDEAEETEKAEQLAAELDE